MLLSDGFMNVTSARVSKILFGPRTNRIWWIRCLDVERWDQRNYLLLIVKKKQNDNILENLQDQCETVPDAVNTCHSKNQGGDCSEEHADGWEQIHPWQGKIRAKPCFGGAHVHLWSPWHIYTYLCASYPLSRWLLEWTSKRSPSWVRTHEGSGCLCPGNAPYQPPCRSCC